MKEANARPFAVFDIDGTLVRWQLYHAIADKLAGLGYIDHQMFQSIIDARMTWKRREHKESFRDYELQLVRIYTEVLMIITPDQFEEAVNAVFEEHKDQVYTFTRDLTRKLKKKGYLLFAISGSQAAAVGKICEYYGFDDFLAREDEVIDGKFTGKSTTPIFNKDKAVEELLNKHATKRSGSIAVGDSAGDIKMLEMVESPIAFNPEERLFVHAKKQGWKVVVERKNMIYELEPKDGDYFLATPNSW